MKQPPFDSKHEHASEATTHAILLPSHLMAWLIQGPEAREMLFACRGLHSSFWPRQKQAAWQQGPQPIGEVCPWSATAARLALTHTLHAHESGFTKVESARLCDR